MQSSSRLINPRNPTTPTIPLITRNRYTIPRLVNLCNLAYNWTKLRYQSMPWHSRSLLLDCQSAPPERHSQLAAISNSLLNNSLSPLFLFVWAVLRALLLLFFLARTSFSPRLFAAMISYRDIWYQALTSPTSLFPSFSTCRFSLCSIFQTKKSS